MVKQWGMLLLASLALAGCSTERLVHNAVEVGSGIDRIYKRQTFLNLSKTIDDFWAVPSQVELTTGTVQTSNVVTPQVTFPLSHSVTENAAGLVTSRTRAGAGMTISANDAWQQTWVIAAVTEAAQLRLLRALYQSAIDPQVEPPYRAFIHTAMRGRTAWLYWRGLDGRSQRLPQDGSETVSLGFFGNHELLVTAADYRSGLVNDFILAVMSSNDPKSAGGKAKGAGSQKRFLIIPQQVFPQIQ